MNKNPIEHFILHSIIAIPKENVNLERKWLQYLIDQFGWTWAVRIEDLLIMFFSILFGFLISIFVFASFFRNRIEYSIRFSQTLNEFMYMWAERGKIKEIIIKQPKTYRDKLEVVIVAFWIRFFDHIPLRERRVREISAIIIGLMSVMIIIFVVALCFALNVVKNPLDGNKPFQ